MSKKRTIAAGVIILIIIFLIVGRMRAFREEIEIIPTPERIALAVRVAEVVSGDIEKTISLSGNIEAEKTVKVYPRVSGKIIQKNVLEGDKVEKGEIIALIDRDEPGFKFELAPVDTFLSGTVGEVYVDLGERVTPHTPVALIVALERIRVRVEVPERDIPRLKVGQEARVEVVAYPDEVFTGRVEKISPVVDIISRRTPVGIIIPNPEHKLKPGMLARVRIITTRQEDILLVPRESLLVREGKEIVYIVENGVAKIRKVETGIFIEDRVEIISGVELGDKVISAGHLNLKDGAKIEIEEVE